MKNNQQIKKKNVRRKLEKEKALKFVAENSFKQFFRVLSRSKNKISRLDALKNLNYRKIHQKQFTNHSTPFIKSKICVFTSKNSHTKIKFK